MNRDEWARLSYMAYTEWWDAPQSDARIATWFPMLASYDAADVEAALMRLLRDSPTFAPRLGELVNALAPHVPSFDEAWAVIDKALKVVPRDGEGPAVEYAREHGGELVAGWLARYGPRKLTQEPLYGEQGGAIMHRLELSWKAATETTHAREVTAKESLPSVTQLVPGASQAQVEG